jgi:3-methylcrotonyl-CoA carboxylase beta subunit
MAVIASNLDVRSEAYRANESALRAATADLKSMLERIAEGGGAAARARHVARGKLLVRDRIQALIDPGSPFLELSPLAGHGLYADAVPAGGIVTGVGRVMGRECMGSPMTRR